MTWTYDRVATITTGSTVTTFSLDALGRHWVRTPDASNPSVTETYSYLGTSQVVNRIDGAGGAASTVAYVDPLGARFATADGSGTVTGYLLPDLHGNTAALFSTALSPSASLCYDPYGVTLSNSSAGSSVPWRYQGRLTESAAGQTDLYDFGARSYDPGLGAFTELDSVAGGITNSMTLNRYLYAEANPATLVDPDGHQSCQYYGSELYCTDASYYGDQLVTTYTTTWGETTSTTTVTTTGGATSTTVTNTTGPKTTTMTECSGSCQTNGIPASPLPIQGSQSTALSNPEPVLDPDALVIAAGCNPSVTNGFSCDYAYENALDAIFDNMERAESCVPSSTNGFSCDGAWAAFIALMPNHEYDGLTFAKGGKQHGTLNDDWVKRNLDTPEKWREMQQPQNWRQLTPQQKNLWRQQGKFRGWYGKKTHFESQDDYRGPAVAVAGLTTTAIGLWVATRPQAITMSPLCGFLAPVCALVMP